MSEESGVLLSYLDQLLYSNWKGTTSPSLEKPPEDKLGQYFLLSPKGVKEHFKEVCVKYVPHIQSNGLVKPKHHHLDI